MNLLKNWIFFHLNVFFLWKIDPFLFFFGFFVDFKLQDCLPFRSKILNMFSTEVFCFHNWSLLFHFFFLFHDFFIFFFRDSKWTWPESARLKGDWVRSWVWIFDPCYFLLGIILLDVSYMIVFARKSQYHSCNVLKYVFNNNFYIGKYLVIKYIVEGGISTCSTRQAFNTQIQPISE